MSELRTPGVHPFAHFDVPHLLDVHARTRGAHPFLIWEPFDGEAKISIARQALDEVLGALPPERELGLIVYGHRQKGDCDDIEVAVPLGPGNEAAIISKTS